MSSPNFVTVRHCRHSGYISGNPLWFGQKKGDLTNAANILQSSQPKRFFPTARAIKRTATVVTEMLVRTAQIVIVLAALFWSPSGGGSPWTIEYAGFLLRDDDERGLFFPVLVLSPSRLVFGNEVIRQSGNVQKKKVGLNSTAIWGAVPFVSTFYESISWRKLTKYTSMIHAV